MCLRHRGTHRGRKAVNSGGGLGKPHVKERSIDGSRNCGWYMAVNVLWGVVYFSQGGVGSVDNNIEGIRSRSPGKSNKPVCYGRGLWVKRHRLVRPRGARGRLEEMRKVKGVRSTLFI